MAYIATGLLTEDQENALLAFPSSQIHDLPIEQRINLAIQNAQYKTRKKEIPWSRLQIITTGLLPVLAFLGFEYFKR